jgi:hypothetical protein
VLVYRMVEENLTGLRLLLGGSGEGFSFLKRRDLVWWTAQSHTHHTFADLGLLSGFGA